MNPVAAVNDRQRFHIARSAVIDRRYRADLFTPINAARSGCFVHHDFAKAGTERLKFLPKPRCHVFDRRIIESSDFVEIRVIELLQERFHRRANFSVIIKPAGRRIDVAFHRDFDFETVPVHPAAFVTLGRIRQCLGRFESKIFYQANPH